MKTYLGLYSFMPGPVCHVICYYEAQTDFLKREDLAASSI